MDDIKKRTAEMPVIYVVFKKHVSEDGCKATSAVFILDGLCCFL